jgi:hypothetical protein
MAMLPGVLQCSGRVRNATSSEEAVMAAALRSCASDGGREHNASANRTAGGVAAHVPGVPQRGHLARFAGRMDADEGLA